MTTLITDPAQITPAWLTDMLRQTDALTRGSVSEVQARTYGTVTATAVPLTLTYSPDARGTRPEKLFLKMGNRKPEVDFYHHLAHRTHHVPMIRCYDAAFDDAQGRSHLLFDNISATHFEPIEALPPTFPTLQALMVTLANLHRQWWEHPDLAAGGSLAPLIDDVPGYVLGQAQIQFPAFVDLLGDRLSDARRQRYERILAALPLKTWTERRSAHHGMTLVHGDTHFWNFAYPKQAGGEILLIDWAVWHINFAVSDIAHMIGHHCYPEHRARIEQPLLRHYHQHLAVEGYDWAQCWHDYRMAVAFHSIFPIFWHPFAPINIWWHNLERIMLAFEDLGCEEFLVE